MGHIKSSESGVELVQNNKKVLSKEGSEVGGWRIGNSQVQKGGREVNIVKGQSRTLRQA